MESFTPSHWIVLLAVIALLFLGRGNVSSLIADVAQGIRNFRDRL